MADLISIGLPGEELAAQVLKTINDASNRKLVLIQLGTPAAKDELDFLAELEYFPRFLLRRWNALLKKIEAANAGGSAQ